MKKIYIGGIIALSIIVSLMYYYFMLPKKTESVDVAEEVIDYLNVNITGEISFPGTYKVITNTKLMELVGYAGGILDSADLKTIDLSVVLKDGKTYEIPKKKSSTESQLKWNLNEVSFKDLLDVPNITEKRASSIIIHRESHGKFNRVDELINVKYIGVATFDKIKDYFFI